MSLLTIEGLTKDYPGVRANDGVSLSIAPGEIHALLGENGAGKSTLVKMIYGLVRPDAGRMTLDGRPYAPAGPAAARAAGIAMVFQHFSLFEALSVAENIALGLGPATPMRGLARRIAEVSAAYGLPLDPDRAVGTLSAGERQRVEIVRCLLQGPRLLIMDEPTSVLTPGEVETLFATLRRLAAEGVAVLYISHKLEEIRALCDRATILRGGRVVATCDPRTQTARSLAEMMVGAVLAPPARAGRAGTRTLLELRGLTLPAPGRFGTPLSDISLTLREGEILGIGGVAGNGQEELLAALSGERRAGPGQILLAGTDIGPLGPEARRGLGLCTAPEERLGHAAAPDMTLVENALISGLVRMRLARAGIIRWGAAAEFARAIVAAFDVRCAGVDHAARSLSGGNLQKFVIGREILQRPAVLAVNQPSWGVDAAAAAAIRRALVDLAASGTGVLVISQDLDELMEISTGFAALVGGRLSAVRSTAGLTVDEIGLMLGGAAEGGDDAAA
ncbi:MAG: ABC transporter ATP-binding protein [Alphaproteobacteria bacterium]|nr:MAG: ABC transporter ATP-binding protein [Alphaproteobacteria bacterium]